MKLTCFGSSSKGNGYVLDNGKEALVLEAGVPYSKVLKAIGYDSARIRAVLVSHEHGDHAGYVGQYLNNWMNVWGSNAMAEQNRRISTYPKGAMKIGGFTVMAFLVNHDVECYGFYIYHEEMGFLVFVTDSAFIKQSFSAIHHIMIEANYDRRMLYENCTDGVITAAQCNRTIQSHMSLKTTIETINNQVGFKGIQNVILLHLSDKNSNEEVFIRRTQKETGKRTIVAQDGLEMELSINPF